MKNLEPVFADILQNAIDAIERKTISFSSSEIEIVLNLLKDEIKQVQALDALQAQPSEYSDTLNNLLNRFKKESRPR